VSRYGQYCPITRSLEMLGDRWTLLVVRDLLVGARRFNEPFRVTISDCR
jgi:DNA-binding HxlR family transcriptional regulator